MLTNKKVYICFIWHCHDAGRLPHARWPPRESPGCREKRASQKTLVVRADRRTGKLVRSVTPVKSSAVQRTALPSIDISEMVEKAARDNQRRSAAGAFHHPGGEQL